MSINMKIVYIYHSFIFKGGIERVFCDKMNYLAQNTSYDVTFITFEQGNHPFAYKLNDRIKVVDINCRFAELWNYNIIKRNILNFILRRKLKKCLTATLKKESPDIVISTTEDIKYNYCIFNLPYRFIVESHVHMKEIIKSSTKKQFFIHSISKIFFKWKLSKINKCKLLVALTDADKRDWSKVINSDIIIIPNILTFYPDKITDYSKRSKRILCVGRLTKQKGFDLMIKAWAIIADKHKEWKVDIFGDGELNNTLNGLIKNYCLDESITIHPATNHIYDEYMDSSIFAFSSRFEGFGLVLIEAMSCGVPCISFDCPHGPSEIITNGRNGLLVQNGNIDEFANSLDSMINNYEQRKFMSINARIDSQKYKRENIMPQWIELFETLSNTMRI